VPRGTYLTGTLWLRSNVELHVAMGATLAASGDRADYNADDAFPENPVARGEQASGAHLVIAYRAENVAITGLGTIDGRGHNFFGPAPEGTDADDYRIRGPKFPIAGWRPGQMIYFCRCRGVTVRDVTLVNSPYWTLFLLGCDDVRVRGLVIRNPAQTPNGDGIDIDCSSRVTVSDCIISTGDDCITFRGNTSLLGEDKPCEDVAVANCVLSSPTCAFRVGVGDGLVHRCRATNIEIPAARTAVHFVCKYSGKAGRGSRITDIDFSGLTGDTVMPFTVFNGHGASAPAGISNVRLRGMRLRAETGSYFAGGPGLPIKGLVLKDWDLALHGGGGNREFWRGVPFPMPHDVHVFPARRGNEDAAALPTAVYGTFLEDATFDSMRIRWEGALGEVWRDGLAIENSSGLDFCGCHLSQPPGREGAGIRLRRSAGVSIRNCRAGEGTRVFLKMDDSPPGAEVRLAGNDFCGAARGFEVDTKVGRPGESGEHPPAEAGGEEGV
jgi:hypothetical protein